MIIRPLELHIGYFVSHYFYAVRIKFRNFNLLESWAFGAIRFNETPEDTTMEFEHEDSHRNLVKPSNINSTPDL